MLAQLRSAVTIVPRIQRIGRIAFPVLLGVVVAGCQRVENDTGISQQQVGFVGGAAGGALVAAAAGASVPWLVGGALIGAGLGTGIATQGQADEQPSGQSFDAFLATHEARRVPGAIPPTTTTARSPSPPRRVRRTARSASD